MAIYIVAAVLAILASLIIAGNGSDIGPSTTFAPCSARSFAVLSPMPVELQANPALLSACFPPVLLR